jgi:hypothetical protein
MLLFVVGQRPVRPSCRPWQRWALHWGQLGLAGLDGLAFGLEGLQRFGLGLAGRLLGLGQLGGVFQGTSRLQLGHLGSAQALDFLADGELDDFAIHMRLDARFRFQHGVLSFDREAPGFRPRGFCSAGMAANHVRPASQASGHFGFWKRKAAPGVAIDTWRS